ncbi:hypothetical protein DEO72_LG8g2069 [Vigna unguiculata]|uniref:Uncharacterized protein n=1 Tax=Vigna unguiculata TaxID=3917 RepID=A0A4D6MRC4_VIGUN|nr:hypothetical protein DEO72_LG8g2069 [Vigna unguiculata]
MQGAMTWEETAWWFIPYRQAAHQTCVLFLFWHEPPGGDEFLPGGATLLRSVLVNCNADCVLINWIIEICMFSFYRVFGWAKINRNSEYGNVLGVEETWFVQALLLRLAASKVPPGDDADRRLFGEFLVVGLRVRIWSRGYEERILSRMREKDDLIQWDITWNVIEAIKLWTVFLNEGIDRGEPPGDSLSERGSALRGACRHGGLEHFRLATCGLSQAETLLSFASWFMDGVTCDDMSGEVHIKLLSRGDTSGEVRRAGLRAGRFVEAGPRAGSSPFLFVCGDDRVIRYTGADVDTGGAEDAQMAE